MTAPAPLSRAASDGRATKPRRRRVLRWSLALLPLSAVCFGTASAVSRQPGRSWVVLLGVDSSGWSFLAGLAGAVVASSSVIGLTYALVRGRTSWWAALVEILVLLLMTAFWLVGGYVGLLGGVLSLKNSYRDIGSVDGHAIVVQHFVGWDTDDDIDAGYRHGALVDFTAAGDTAIERPPTEIDRWRFHISTTRTTVIIRYRLGAGSSRHGTLELPRAPRPEPGPASPPG